MPEILENAFIGKSDPPTDANLAAALGGPAHKLWHQLLAELSGKLNLSTQDWNSYSPKAGWALRLKRGKRNIVYLGPGRGSFRASFVLGGKAVQAAHDSGLPARTLKLIDEGQRYPEGTAVRVEVKRPADVAIVVQLAALKIAN